MNSKHLSKRLDKVADYVEAGARLADIGSDHAYLPVYLVKEGKIDFAIAGEVVEGPYQSAVQEVASEGVEDQVFPRFGDGLEVVTEADQIDTLTICGMGGKLITEILDRGLTKARFPKPPQLILQANVYEAGLRRYLLAHHYEIVAETIVAEAGKFYEIMLAQYRDQVSDWSKQELQFGRYIAQDQPDVFKAKWQSVRQRHEMVLAGLDQAQTQAAKTKREEFSRLIAEIDQVLED